MAIRIRCPHCGHVGSDERKLESLEGTRVRCAGCECDFTFNERCIDDERDLTDRELLELQARRPRDPE